MILILSIDSDYSTDIVIQWLKYYNAPFIRINSYNLFEDDLVWDIENNTININNNLLCVEDIKIVWYRKFGYFSETIEYKALVQKFGVHESYQIMREFASIYNGFFGLLDKKKWLLNPTKTNLNKLEVLSRAVKYGLKIPKSYITNKKENLKLFSEKRNYISKSANDPMFLKKELGFLTMYTTRMTTEKIDKVPTSFFSSLIQEEIKKAYEVRSFLLDKTIYSMAIFSQSNNQTEVDFRKYAWNKPNRFVPYKLPEETEEKLLLLFQSYGLNTGSVDFIRGLDGNYYFLEINPSGQFGMIDFNCNYGLHEKVAKYLIENNN